MARSHRIGYNGERLVAEFLGLKREGASGAAIGHTDLYSDDNLLRVEDKAGKQIPALVIHALGQEVKNIDTSDPIYIMMSKSKKVDNIIEMSMTVSMPAKSLYNVAEESFDEGGQKVVEYIIDNIDVNDIKDALKIAIAEMYEKKTRVISSIPKEERSQLHEGT